MKTHHRPTPSRRFLNAFRRTMALNLRSNYRCVVRRRLTIESLEDRSLLATVTWDGGAGTFNFGDALNWSNDTAPSAANDYVIPDLTATPTIVVGSVGIRSIASAEKIQITSGLNVSADSSMAGGLDFVSGTLTINNGSVLTLQGSSSWAAGLITGTGTLRNQGVFDVTGSTGLRTVSTLLDNTGTMNRDGSGSLQFGTSGRIQNSVGGVFQVSTSGTANVSSTGGAFDNLGTFRLVTSASGTATYAGTFTNSGGTIEVQSGNLRFTGASTFTNPQFAIASGGTVEVQSGSQAFFSGTVVGSGSGKLRLHGVVTVSPGGVSLTTPIGMTESIATLRLQGTGNFEISSGSDYRLASASTTFTTSAPITVNGELLIDSTASLSISGTVLVNAAGKVRIRNNAVMAGSTGHIQNYGEIISESGTNTFTPILDNFGGTIRSISGTLIVQNSGTALMDSATVLAATGSQISFRSARTWKGTITGSGGGRVFLGETGNQSIDASGVVLNFPDGFATLGGGSASSFAGGEIYVPSGSFIDVGPTLSASSVQFTNQLRVAGTLRRIGLGLFRVSLGGSIQIEPSGVFRNEMQAAISGVRNILTFNSSPGLLTNAGTLVQNVPGSFDIQLPFVNTGTVRIQQGSLSFSSISGGPQSLMDGGTLDVSAGATLGFGALRTWKGEIAGTGSGTLTLNTADLDMEGGSFIFDPSLNSVISSTITGGTLTVPGGSKVGVGSATLATTLSVYGVLNSTATLTLTNNTLPDGRLQIKSGGVMQLRNGLPVGADVYIDAGGTLELIAGNITATAGTIRNAGSIRKSSSSSSGLNAPIDFLGGSIDVDSGSTLTMSVGTTSITDPIINVATGGTFTISGNQTWKGRATGTGGGSIVKTGILTIDSSGLILDFPTGMFTLRGSLSIFGPGPLSIADDSYVRAESGTITLWDGTALDVFGTLNLDSSSWVALAPIHVYPGGVLEATGTSSSIQNTARDQLFLNEGTIRNNANGFALNMPLDSRGIVDVQSGIFTIGFPELVQHPGTDLTGGTWIIQSNSTLNFPSTGASVNSIGAGATVDMRGAARFPKLEASLSNAGVQSNSGNLLIRDGKNFSAYRNFENSGTITIDNGILSIQSTVTNISGSYVQHSGATVLNNSTISTPTISIDGGTLSGTGTLGATVFNNGGVMVPGASPGILTITGSYTQGPNGSLNIEVAGTNPTTPDFDQLIISQDATLDGTLNAFVINDFLPSKGETFRFLTAANVFGDFQTKNLAVYQEYPLFAGEKGSNYYDLTSRNIIVRNANDSGPDSLRQAILTANADTEVDNILLHIPGAGPHKIAAITDLPIITQPVNIDGYAQNGASRNTLATGSDAVIKVELNGDAVISGTGLLIHSDNVTVTGLSITGWADEGIVIESPADSGTHIVGNFIGLKPDGATAVPNSSGVLLDAGARNVTIGGTTPASRNVISGNVLAGVLMEFGGTEGNVVLGNYIGTNPQGTAAIGNSAGVQIDAGADSNTIGGVTAGARNLISGNTSRNVWITGIGSEFNSVLGNFIGTDATGNSTIGPPINFGVLVDGFAYSNIIGGATATAGTGPGNVIAGHLINVHLETDSTQVQGNLIGTNASGSAALGGDYGIFIANSATNGNTIGGNTASLRNVISGNSIAGVRIENPTSMFNQVTGNYIGLNRSGDASLPNGIGIQIRNSASNNTIGGLDSSFGNTISGNIGSGIEISDATTSNNLVIGNTIGLLPAGSVLPNSIGIEISDAASNTIGGTSFTSRNVISGNREEGISIKGSTASGNLIQSNAIGTDPTATSPRPNHIGVYIGGGAHDNFVGQTTASRNIISGNTESGVRISGSSTVDNTVAGNTIGLGYNSEIVGNGIGIIDFESGASNTIGGSLSTSRNTISGNQGNGVWSLGSTSGLTIEGNLIGLDPNGTVDRGNQGSGVVIESASIQVFSNTISGNGLNGIEISGTDAVIGLNRIGLDHSGAFAIGNDAHGVRIRGGAILASVTNNTIAGNSAGIRDEGSQSTIKSNLIGTNASGLKMLGNRRGSGVATGGHFGIYSSGSNATIGDAAASNIIAGHDVGLWLNNANASTVVANLIGTDALEVASMSNTVGLQMSGSTSGVTLSQNTIANSLTVGLRLLDGTSANNQFTSNRYFGNLGASIDAGVVGPTLNDSGDSDGLLNFPVLEYADIAGNSLMVRGFVGAGRSVELYVSTPTINGLGQGSTSLGIFVEGSVDDSDSGSGSYGPDLRGVTVGTAEGNRFEFTIPLNTLPPALRYGSLVTAVALGSTSEFGNAIPIGDPATALAPKVFLPLGVSLVQGESLRVQGSFRDDDSTSWTLTVDYGDGSGPQPLSFAPDHTFILEHTYPEVSSVPYQVTVTAIDNANRVGVGVMGVTVGNEPPQPTFNSFEFTPIVSEGQAVTLEGAFTDSGDNDSHTVSIDWGDGSTPTLIPLPVGARNFTSLHVYPDDGLSNSSSEFYRIRITVSDNLGGFSTTPDGLYIVEVKNELPTIPSVTAPASLIENQLFGLSGSFDDPGLLDTHTVTVDWGDGSPLETLSTSQLIASPITRVFSVLHRFPDNPAGTATGYNVTIEVVDDDQPLLPVRMTKFIEVVNETPSATNIAPSALILLEGDVYTLNVELDDSGPRDSHQVVIDWGDGSENKVIDLAPGVFQIPTATHRYANDPASGSLYTVQVKIRDKDMPSGVYDTDTRQVSVSNVAPVVTELKLFTRSGTGPWIEQLTPPTIVEGDEVKVVGQFTDPGKFDIINGTIEWSPGVTSSASVSMSNRTFESRFRYTDDFPIGTLFDDEAILVTLQDADGGIGTATTNLRVTNAAPVVSFIPEVVTNPQFIPLVAQVKDPGTEAVSLQWQASNGTTVLQTGSGPTFQLNLALFGAGPIVVSVTASDDDGGTHTSTAGLMVGTANADTLTINGGSFLTAGVNTILMLGMGGTDILDASAVPAPFRVILDGGDAQDFLYGGGGDDTFILRAGDDSANVDAVNYPTPVTTLPIPNITPNYAGNDKYYLKPNSTLTVVDLDGTLENSLDFSIASMAIAFNLDTTRGALLVPQEVSVGGHYVAAIGGFNELTGSQWNDLLTGASQSTVYGGPGADQLKAITGTTDARFSGGQDADVFETSGAGLTSISFEGDEGADTFTNLGQLGFDIEFRGGADADVFTNTLTGILESLSFEGDDGADVFINAGLFDAIVGSSIVFQGGSDADVFTNLATGILETLSFEGDDGADVFTNAGDLLTQVYFLGGADADVFTNAGTGLVESLSFEGDDGADVFMNQLSGILVHVSFEGDDGADVFTNLGVMDAIAGGSIEFLGGADADVFTNGTTGILEMLSFEGDDGADVFTNAGLLDATVVGSIVFTGGADADVFVNSATGIIELLSFEGDDGADTFTNIGTLDAIVGGGISFQGGADADVFTNIANGIIESLSFEGDDGADVFTNAGLLDAVTGGSIIFMGGADADVFTNTLSGLLESLSFEGDDGADVFTNFGLLDAVAGGSIVFTGGADADVFSNASSGILESLSFEGDDGADVFVNAGLFDAVGITIIEFMGGADADVFTNLATGIVETLSFEGDDGADVFVNYGNLLGVLGDVVFTGGADADVFVNKISGLATNISFEGDDGADVFENLGDVLATGQIVFTGGADGDRLYNADSGMNSIRFIGYLGSTSSPTTNDDSADVFVNLGDLIGLISFEGDDGADVFSNAGDSISTLSFEGDDGADVFVSLGDLVGAISFEGDGGDDVLGVYGTNIGAILFAGDPTDIGNDTFVNRSSASPTGPGTLAYYGFGGNDALRNDGRGWKVQFYGYADDDAFQNNADLLTELEFRGDDGRDVFENNGNSLFDILFEGDDGADVFANGGDFVSQIHFVGGADGDVFVNSGDWISQLRFEGDDGADVFANLGADLTSISFEGDAGNDRVLNDGRRMSLFTFVGGAGGDTFVNHELAVGARNLRFSAGLGDDGRDVFINQASALDGFVFSGGADADVFQNSGMDVVNVSFEGDDGADSVLNTGFGLGEFRFVGGADADVFENRGDGLFSIAFEGGAGPDSFVQRGNRSVDFFFTGGQDADVFTNFGSYLTSLRFEGDDGENRFQNNGSDIETIEFVGGADADSFQNNNDRIETIGFQGDGGSDTLLNNGSDVGSILFVGDDGADALVHVGDNIVSIEFLAGTDSDIMRLSGAQLQSVNFDGNEGTDSLLLDASVTQLTFTGGTENDIAILRGSLQSASVALGEGDDRFAILGQSVAVTLNGGLGDDTFEFAGTPSGLYNLVEMYYGAADTSNDTIDLSSMTGDANLDLSLTTIQTQSNGVAIQLSDGMGIERVMGTSGADNLRGNPRDNYVGGAQFYYADADRTPLVAPRPTQWVVLDFSDTEPLRGEYIYTETDRQAIVLRLEQAYAAFNQSHAAIRFTWNIEEVPTGTEYVTLYFNRTPDSGRPGGDASEVDLGNKAYGGFANIQANGLLGGIEIPTTDNEDFMESLPEDSESRLGQDKPSATVANMIEISAKIAAHELAHLLGLRHYDSFGPIGFGVHSPPGNSDFKPIFVGPSAAFETFDHLIGSPASVGSTRNNDVRGLFFGEREAIKIAYSLLDPLSTTVEEFSADVNSPQAVDWVPISVPNSLTSGLNQPKDFVVDIASVRGSIELDGNAVSQSDFYRFAGQRGDLLTIEVLSKSLRRYLNGGVDGYIDSMIRVRDANGALVPYHTGFAMNDDEFESSDSLLLDLQLPDNGEYVLEVDTFSRPSTDPFYLDAIQSRDELLALTAPSAEQQELLEILNDSLLDQDVGNYEVFMYRFQKASSIDLIDRLAGGGGQDMIDGGPGDFGIIDFVPFPPSITLPEANHFQFTIDFLDERALSFTAEVDYGDGSGLQPTTVVLTPQPHILLDHDYRDNGSYQLSFSIRSNWGALGTGNIALNVTNRSPELGTLAVVGAPFQEGSTITISTSGIDPAGSLDPLEYTFQVWKDTDANPIYVATYSNPTTTFTPNDNGTYRIEVTVHDGDGGFDQSTTTVTVDNLSPTATINSPDPIDEGASTAITLVGADVSSVDATILKYSFALTESSLADDYSAASSANSAVFAFIDNGIYTVYGRVYDKDGGTSTYTTKVTVNNTTPTATINSPDPIDEGASATITLVGTDASSVDATTLRYSISLTESSLAGDYSAASSTNSAIFAFIDNGIYTVYGRVFDKDGGVSTYTTIVTVNNITPTATISSPEPIDEGASTAITLVGVDVSSVDTASLKYSFALTESSLADDYSAATSTNTAVLAFADNGIYTVYGRVYDKDGGTNTYTTIVTVNNVAPTATLQLSNSIINVGQSVNVQLMLPIDPSTFDVSAGLRYSFAQSTISLANTYASASTSATATFPFSTSGAYSLYARIFDKDDAFSEFSAQITVIGVSSNTPPTLSLIGPVDSVQNVSSGFTLNASDADSGDSMGPFTYVIQWGDGTSNTVTGGSTVVVNKIFANVSSEQGVFRITATVTDARGATSSTATRNQAVMGWTVSVDPLNTSRRILTIVGSQSDDSIKLRDSNRHDDVIRVKVKNKEDDVKIKGFASSDVDRILIFGLGGDDHIDVDQDIDIQAQIWGGHGNDKINGGGGSDVLLGEVGDDKLDGGDGRDLLIGGMGRDDLRGDRGDDILIAGYTVYDQNRSALDLIMAEWARTDCDSTYERRRKNLSGTSHPTFGARRNENIFLRFGTNNSIPATVDTVFDDNVEDVLRGEQGNDWFLLELTGPNEQRDKLKDLAHGERADDL